MPLLLIHPQTGLAIMATTGEGRLARALILAGYEPVGPKGQAAAKVIREQAGVSVRVTWRNDNPDTIWNRLAAKLGREPTPAEAKAEVRRILSEAPDE